MLCCALLWLYIDWFPISIRLTSLALWQSNDCPNASKATLMNMDQCFMWIHYERLHDHNKAKHNKTVCIFLRIYCKLISRWSQCPISVIMSVVNQTVIDVYSCSINLKNILTVLSINLFILLSNWIFHASTFTGKSCKCLLHQWSHLIRYV